MFTLLACFGCFVGGVLGHAYAYPVLVNLWAKVTAFFKKEEKKIVPVTPPSTTPSA